MSPDRQKPGKKGRKNNLNFEISLLKAKVGEEPKIKRCALVVKHDKKAEEVDREKIEEEIRELARLKREGVAHHEKKVLRKVIKEGVRPEIQKLSKRIKAFQFSLDKLRSQGDAVPAKVVADKEANVSKLEAQLATLKHLDLDIAAAIAWESLDGEQNVEEVASRLIQEGANQTEEEQRQAPQQRAAYMRAVRAAAVTAKIEEMRRQRMAREARGGERSSGDEGDEGDEGEGDSSEGSGSSDESGRDDDGRAGANARKAQDKQKAISILAKLGAARDDDESGSDAAVGSASDQSEDESGSEDDGSDGNEADSIDYDDDLFVGSLKAADGGDKKRGGRQKGSEKKGPPKKKERKNRLGQRARRALAEKIHGQNAKHLKAEQPGQRGGARQQTGHQQRPAASERRPPRNDKEGKKPFSKPRQQKDGWQASDANRTPLGQPSRTPPKADEKLHPSWEASQKRKQQASALTAFQGKKMKLSDD